MSNRKFNLMIGLIPDRKPCGEKINEAAGWLFNNNEAFDVIHPIHQLNTFFGPHDHYGGGQAVCQHAVVRNDGNTDNTIGNRVTGARVNHV